MEGTPTPTQCSANCSLLLHRSALSTKKFRAGTMKRSSLVSVSGANSAVFIVRVISSQIHSINKHNRKIREPSSRRLIRDKKTIEWEGSHKKGFEGEALINTHYHMNWNINFNLSLLGMKSERISLRKPAAERKKINSSVYTRASEVSPALFGFTLSDQLTWIKMHKNVNKKRPRVGFSRASFTRENGSDVYVSVRRL